MINNYRDTKLVVNLHYIKYNINEIKKYVGTDIQIMLIVKANGYGSHINFCPELLNQFNYVAVALIEEAILLRNNGYKNNIFILYPISKKDLSTAIKNNFIINGSNILEIITSNFKKNIRIHIELETGMGRTGLQLSKLKKYLSQIQQIPNIIVDGIFTHLSSNSDKKFSLNQISLFEKQFALIHTFGINPPNIHISSSGGLMYYKNHLHNMVRIGLLIYGYYPNDSLKQKIILKPSMVLKTKIRFLKEIDRGETVGYNKNFIAKKKSKIATIPFGFADGLIGLETGEAYLLINGQPAKIVGICMDNMMLDVTGIPNVKVGTNVYIWDNKKILVDKVGKWCNGICNYEVLTSISERVPRVFENGDIL